MQGQRSGATPFTCPLAAPCLCLFGHVLVWGWNSRSGFKNMPPWWCSYDPRGANKRLGARPPRDTLCLVPVTSCEFQPCIPTSGPRWQLEASCQCSSLAPAGEMDDVLASCCPGEGRTKRDVMSQIFLSLTYTNSTLDSPSCCLAPLAHRLLQPCRVWTVVTEGNRRQGMSY